MQLSSWTGLFVPAATPRPVVLRLRQAIEKIASSPAFKDHMTARSFTLFSPSDVDAFVKTEVQRWPPLLAKVGLKPE